MKTCTKCREIKELKEFRKRKDAKDGLSHWCKSCANASHSSWEKDKQGRKFEKTKKEDLKKQNKKQCTGKCKQIKDLSEFDKREDSKDGLRGWCTACVVEQKKGDYLNNVEERREYNRNSYLKNREDRRKKQKVLNLKHKKEKPNYHKDYYDKNREEILAKKSDYIQANLGKIIAKNMKRYASSKKRTPPWLTTEHHKESASFYELAHELRWLSEKPLHVDHIVPLHGKNVSGLHVPWNLQILPENLNTSKGNKFDQIEHDRIGLFLLIKKFAQNP